MSKTIAIDLDGVIFDTERYFRVASEIEDVNKYGLNNKIDNRNVRFQDRYNSAIYTYYIIIIYINK